ncbi:hypothetical protein JEOAER750_01357 [Jeotgalicoccus aerolatus]|uniref:DUF2922 domain-containing protein n=1 Tax=Jeotgalicoccus aerolatus TaxID=709510 RepID=A0ABS4HKX9_9STAP|nr:DUF2922 domain-containing protein [Jeotgalicoccus aerolatus]MBP1951581.1 hypothetical protein [Jeotgalicoccus aerolatus]GGD96424.1 hypothetical protein GCM10007273_05940 [Jeotgalicoccus aerolatus]CAD2076059.1 hypothetical protein JEOAER750_01357 [Jeotgalicoccus aerolatus]
MDEKLVLVFNTNQNKRFTLTVNNPKEGITAEEVEAEAARLIAEDIMRPSQGIPVSLYSAKIVNTATTVLK